jgi:hypothetical protein
MFQTTGRITSLALLVWRRNRQMELDDRLEWIWHQRTAL